MAIDGVIARVIVYENGGGRLELQPRKKTIPVGQPILNFDSACEEVTALNGVEIWGSARILLIGEKIIATRKTTTKIEFVSREEFLEAIAAERKSRNKKPLHGVEY